MSQFIAQELPPGGAKRHPYPKFIPAYCHRRGFGPPEGVTPLSACPWLDHPVSGQVEMTAVRSALLKILPLGTKGA